MTKDYFWRTVINNAVYVDSNSGDDINGYGTKESPYQTLGRAYRGNPTKPATIVCRGYFSEDMADGNHSCNIYAEYPGAAIFDGKEMYTLYGFSCNNMIVNNCIPGNNIMNVFQNNSLFAGVGRASSAGLVGVAGLAADVPGFSGSKCVFKNCGHYFGHIGGSGNYNVISNPKHNDTYLLFLWGNTNSSNWCIHGVKKDDRTVSKNSTATGNNFFKSIFTDVAFYINDHITFNGCYFGNDCTWWNNTTNEQIMIEGTTSEEKINFLKSKIEQLGASNTNCSFVDCVFLDKNASEIYNNHELGDFTTKPNANIPSNIGVFGPALNIPIKDSNKLTFESDITNMWDPDSTINNIIVSDSLIILSNENDNTILNSEIYTGIIDIDTDKYNINSLFTEIASKFDKQISISEKEITGNTYNKGDILSVGKYVVKGNIIYNGLSFYDGDILTVTLENTSFSVLPNSETNDYIVELINPNIEVLPYARSFSAIIDIKEGNSINLEDNKTYVVLESNGKVITSSGRILYKGSIIDGSKQITVTGTNTVKLGILSTLNSDWCPFQSWGNLFLVRDGNNIVKDENGVPLSSGNANCYTSNTNGGAAKTNYNYTGLTQRYHQFKIVARKVC